MASAPIGNIADYQNKTGTSTDTEVSRATNSKTPDKDMFLKLLLAQMKYQDPMNPTDSAQYLSQMAQFTTVEKLENMVDNTASLLTATQMQSGLGMVGSTVEYGVGKAAGSGVVTGVTIIDGAPQLIVDGKTKVPFGDLTSVKVTGTGTPKKDDSKESGDSQKNPAS